MPLVYLARAFDFQLIWNSGTRTAALTTPVEGFQARDLAEIEAPAHDYSESNQLPLTGYFKASLTGEFAGREVRYYIPDTAVIQPLLPLYRRARRGERGPVPGGQRLEAGGG